MSTPTSATIAVARVAADAGDRHEELPRFAKGAEGRLHVALDRRDGSVGRVDLVEVQLEHHAVVRRDVPSEGLHELSA